MVSHSCSMCGRHALFDPTSRIQCKIMFRLTHTTFDGCLFISSRQSDRIDEFHFFPFACQRIERLFSRLRFTLKLRSFNWKLFVARVHHCRDSSVSLVLTVFFRQWCVNEVAQKATPFSIAFSHGFRGKPFTLREKKNSYASIHNSKLHSHAGVCLHAHLFAFWFPLFERTRVWHIGWLHHFDGS